MIGFNFDTDDIASIKLAINEGGKIWDSKHLDGLKKKIKAHYRTHQGEQCCYCRKNSHGEFNMVLDIEHILPKGRTQFRKFMFNIINLSVSCKRCNMLVKKDDISFITETADFENTPFDSANYKFIHPNVDKYFQHLIYEVSIKNDVTMIKYSVVASSYKGAFTYKYFKLNELEIDSFNRSQGLDENVEISNSIASDIALEVEQLLG